ncbi:MAG: class C beta-lactamase-related serine hydrolase [Chitinophagaceae bacterium]|nr:MAG: class C beta-lactamase-related serine hydrolase [Chitinophagaceae bacterium]
MKKIALVYLLFLGGCLKESGIKPNAPTTAPVTKADGWEISTPSSESVDESALATAYQQFFSETDLPHASSLLVVRNGKLISEAYANSSEGADELHNVMSCTKSIVSILFGIAQKQNLIGNINTPVATYFPELVPDDNAKRRITLRNCLTMQTGLAFDGGPSSRDLAETGTNSVSFIFDQPVISDTGTAFLYSDFPPHLVNAVLGKVTGQRVQDFATTALFQPLAINDFKWDATKDGLNYGAFSLFLKPRDLAKLGQLCIQNGNWKGTELIPPGWLEEATSKQVSELNYGYFFWLDPTRKAYAMRGNGGQFVLIAPEKNLVIVYTAFPYSSPELWGNTEKLISTIYSACD